MTSRRRLERYYDQNTLPFLILGGGQGAYTLHRRLWGPGVSNTREASGYIHELIADELVGLGAGEPLTILDLGCGVGGTLFDVARLFPGSRLYGVTISGRQHRIANLIRRRKRLEGRCHFVLGDFHDLRIELRADLVLAIESFVHSRSPAEFFEAAAEHLAAGGHLVVVDDFLARNRSELGRAAARHVADFEEGWRLSSLCTLEELDSASAPAGLVRLRSRDLTDLIALDRLRDRAIGWASALLRRSNLTSGALFANLIGGNALHTGLRDGFIRYHAVILRKGEPE